MKKIVLIFWIVFSFEVLPNEGKRPIKFKFPTREELIQNVDPSLRKNAKEVELKALRRSKEMESDIVKANQNKQIIKDYLKIKKRVTVVKEIQGENFTVLKDLEGLRDEFDIERKKIEEEVKKYAKEKYQKKLEEDKKRESLKVAVDQSKVGTASAVRSSPKIETKEVVSKDVEFSFSTIFAGLIILLIFSVIFWFRKNNRL
ncbi:MAG: hypothetical protein AB7I27_12630 [Bacteriovoracaceae bacterium]